MIYIYGPMRGIPRFNFQAFFAEELRLNDAGFDVYNPARVDMEEDGFDPDNPHPREMMHYVSRDLRGLEKCTGMSGLKGWEDSRGAYAEHHVGAWMGLNIKRAKKPTKEYLERAEEEIRLARQYCTRVRESVLSEAERLVHGSRGADYGHPRDDFSRTGRIWGAVLGLPDVPPEKVALCMVGVKMSRECNRPKRDNRVDGAGYFETCDMCMEE